MMRYALFNVAGETLAESDTAQDIADKATPGTYSEDTADNCAWRFTVYEFDIMGIVGVPMMHRTDAIAYCEKMGAQNAI